MGTCANNTRMIGIFGGSFDPIHLGHLRAALELRETLGLEQVRFIPCRRPPHRAAPVASAEQRAALLEAALRGEPAFRVDARELHRDGPSYTVDTLLSLRAELGAAPLCLILGMDAFQGFSTWHRWREVIELAHLVVAHRPGWMPPQSGAVAEMLAQRRVHGSAELRQSPGGRVLLCPVTQLDISSSHIRALVADGRSPRYLVPETVWALIQAHNIYRRAVNGPLRPGIENR